MTKTKFNTLLATTAVLALSACGGSGDGTAANPTQPPPTTTLKSYNDGSGVITGRLRTGENFSLATTNLETGLRVANGTLDLVEVDGFEDGKFYFVRREGISNSGDELVIETFGEILNLSGSEYTALSLVIVNDELGILSAGTPTVNLPTGTYVYSGTSSVAGINGDGDGTFAMNVNFNTNKADIAASIPENTGLRDNPAYFFGADNISINSSSGSFSSSSAKIGLAGTSGNDASVHGYFAGSSAQGVHGIVYENGSTAQYTGGFYGSR